MERYLIHREADIGIAVWGVQAKAQVMGFGSLRISQLATAVSELATNIIKYCPDSGGDILLYERSGSSGVELIMQARDNGPGIADINAAMQDHFSTSGSLGLGLPGVRRIADDFEIVSVPDIGTIVTVSIRLMS